MNAEESDMISDRIRMAVEDSSYVRENVHLDDLCSGTLAVTSDDFCDIGLGRTMAGSEHGNETSSEGIMLEQSGVSIVVCHEEIVSPSLDESECKTPAVPDLGDVSITNSAFQELCDISPKERMRRERVRQRKMAQRQSAAFREKERQKAKERMQTLRNDPVYRFHEQQRDRERRRNARLNNQAQRAREREKDRVRKSITRALNSERQSDKVHLEGFQLLLGVNESDEGEEPNEVLAWENGSPPP